MTPEQQYFHDIAWENLRSAWTTWGQGRKAKAQQLLLEAFYFANKVPAEFTDREFSENLNRISRIISRGY